MSQKALKRVMAISFAGIVLLVAAYNLWAYQGTLLSPVLSGMETDIPHKPLNVVMEEKVIFAPIPDPWLEVVKSKHLLTVYSGKTALKSYEIALGNDHLVDKEKAGDSRTPEGEFIISYKNTFSPPKRILGSRIMLLNYPNREDAVRGLKQGLITSKEFLSIENAVNNNATPPQDTALGGSISIHGGGGPFMGNSWTKGSIGMYSKDIEEIYGYVPAGTRVVIVK